MRRPAVRLLLTLAISAFAVGAVPATTEAGIIPWAYDTVFGPLGSIQARHVGYYGGGSCNTGACNTGYSAGYGVSYYQGPAPRLFAGLRARRMAIVGYGGYYGSAAGCGTCSTGYGYSVPSCGGCGSCSSCGVGDCGTGGCNTSGYGSSGYIFDGGYGAQGCSSGCSTGQCNSNYGPTNGTSGANNSGVSTASPVTPAVRPSATTDANSIPKTNGPTQYDNQGTPSGRSGTNDGYQLPIIQPGEGFRPRNTQEAAPTGGDPAADGFVPPKVNSANKPESNGEASPSDATNGVELPEGLNTPPVVPVPKAAPKRNFGDDDDETMGTSVGPRLELQEKITWHRNVQRSRQNLSAVRVSATVSRTALFPKMAWKTSNDSELAKK